MTEEEIEKEAEEYVESKGKEHFRKFYDKQLSIADLLKTCCMEFATEATKELQEENKQAKEIIRELITLVDFLNEENVKEPLVAKTQAFLKE